MAAGFYGIPIPQTEIIDLANPSSSCKMWAELPLGTPTQTAVGGFLGNAGMLMCGGQRENNVITDNCYLITSDNVLQTSHSLSKPLMASAGAIINNTFKAVLIDLLSIHLPISPLYQLLIESIEL